jgi:hypothetical protein
MSSPDIEQFLAFLVQRVGVVRPEIEKVPHGLQ